MTSAQAAAQVRRLPPERVTVGLWLRSWAEWFPGERVDSTAVHDAYMLEPFIREHGERPLQAVTRLDAQAWALGHRSQVRYLRRVWRLALLAGLVDVNVWEIVELPRAQGRPVVVPSLEQLDAIIARAGARGGWWAEFADLIETAAFTGARLGGMASLGRSAVDLGARRVILLEKGSKRRRVALTPRSEAALRRQLERRYGPLVFVSEQGRALHRNRVGECWREVRGDFAGTFHSLKHFAATWLLSLGVDERDIAVQLGHTDAAGRPYVRLVQRVYGHPDNDDALARVEQAARSDA